MRTLKNIAVILTALSILAAGVILPDLLINRKLESQIKAKNYVESEDMHRYGEEFYESRIHFNRVLSHVSEMRGEYEVYGTGFEEGEVDVDQRESDPMAPDPADSIIDEKFDLGYNKLLSFLSGWNNAVYTAFREDSSRSIGEMSFDDGTTLGVVQCADYSGLYGGMIIFDTETGIPLDGDLFVYNSGSIGIEDLWQKLVSVYSGRTSMDFDAGDRMYYSLEDGVVNLRSAANNDASIKIEWEGVAEREIYIIHFYLE